MFRRIFITLFMSVLPVLTWAQTYEAGVHYQPLAGAENKSNSEEKVTVTAVFSYMCVHCANLEPSLAAWIKTLDDSVEIKHLPVVFSSSWEPMARAYYVAEISNKTAETHQAMFDEIHVNKQRMRSVDDIAEFYARFGIETEEFEKLYNSFAVDTRLRQGQVSLRNYQVNSTPTFIVNGKYRVTAAMAGSNAEMFRVLEYLIEKES